MDLNGEAIKGKWYAEELQKVRKPDDDAFQRRARTEIAEEAVRSNRTFAKGKGILVSSTLGRPN